MTSKNEREVVNLGTLKDGSVAIRKEILITPEQMGAHCGLFGEVTLVPGAVLGFHEHHGETETYYFTTGTGMYDNNGTKFIVRAGDVVFCEDGKGHGLENTGEADLSFIALILKN